MRNEQVIMAWVSGKVASNGRGSLTTDGSRLLSYDLVIGDSNSERVFDYTASGEYYSQTTSKHVGLALRLSGFEVCAPPNQAELRLWKSSPRPLGKDQGPVRPRNTRS
jgi:hypothetical protein